MPRTAYSIISRAVQIAKAGNISSTGQVSGYLAQALDELNSILDHICQTVDFAKACRQFNFAFNTNLVSSGDGNIITASPNPLPLDYLRVTVSTGSTGAQRSSKWYFEGVPYDMVEIDLTEWDDQVQQAGIQSYPYFWAKDMSLRAILQNFTGDLNSASQTVQNVSSVTGLVAGMSAAGGIGPQSVIVPGTTIINVGSTTIELSQAPSLTLPAASIMAGYPGVGYPYPPPSGAYPVMIRYQAMMPPLTMDQVNAGAYCWFDDDKVLVPWLAAALSQFTDDSRSASQQGFGDVAMARYTKLADDNANRSQTVQLDRRTFGKSFSTLKNTKTIGW